MGYGVMSNHTYHLIINTPIIFDRVYACQFLTFLPLCGSAAVRSFAPLVLGCASFLLFAFLFIFYIFFFFKEKELRKRKLGQTPWAESQKGYKNI